MTTPGAEPDADPPLNTLNTPDRTALSCDPSPPYPSAATETTELITFPQQYKSQSFPGVQPVNCLPDVELSMNFLYPTASPAGIRTCTYM